MDSINETLDGILDRYRLKQGVLDYQVIRQWETIVGRHLSSRTRPLRVQNGELWIFVESSALIQHLSFYASRIVHRIQDVVPGSSVHRIRFTLRQQESK